jgi:hypothetical protein
MSYKWKIKCYQKRLAELKIKNKIRLKVLRIRFNNCVSKFRIMKHKLMSYYNKIYKFKDKKNFKKLRIKN